MVFSQVCTYTAIHVKQHSEIYFGSQSDFHMIAVLVHLIASIHAYRTYVYAHKVSRVDVSIIGVRLSAVSKSIVQEPTTSLST